MFWNSLLLTMALTSAAGPVADVPAAKRVALVIGNGDYPQPLVTSRNDGRDMAATLRGLDFAVIHLEDANLTEMRLALLELASRTQEVETVLFYFAGHGVQVATKNYLLPARVGLSATDDISEVTLGLDEVLDVFWSFERSSKIVIIDACRDNPMGLLPGLAKPVNAPAGTLTLFAAQPNEPAIDGRADVGHSPFTRAILNLMTEPGLELRDLAAEVRKVVLAATDNGQTPWEDGAPLGSFYFRAPATIEGKILEADDEALVLVNGEEMMSYANGTVSKAIPLKPGDNKLIIKVFNQSTFQGGCNWFRDVFDKIRPLVPTLRAFGVNIDPNSMPQSPEGWFYKIQFHSKGANGTQLLREFADVEHTPEEKGPRHGKMFTVATAIIRVNRVTGAITLEDVWKLSR